MNRYYSKGLLVFFSIFILVFTIILLLVVPSTKAYAGSFFNKQIVDWVYGYDYACISLQDGTYVEGKVDSWRDYEDGDQLQVCIEGNTYLVHASNCTLIKYKS